MKSFLIKKGFIISYLEKEEFLDKSKSIDYDDCLKLVCRNLPQNTFGDEKQKKILKFHYLRNEIQHRAINIHQDKKTEIALVYPYFKELYNLMFPEYADDFPN